MGPSGDPRVNEMVAHGQQALRSGNLAVAHDLFQRAAAANPADIGAQMHLALTLRQMGDPNGALKALDQALAADPYFFVALLSKGSVLEELGKTRKAAETYRHATQAVPPGAALPPEMQGAMDHAREMVKANAEAMEAYLQSKVDTVRKAHADIPLERFDECLSVMAGTTKIYESEAQLLKFPRVPALPFYDRSFFPWFAELEAATDMIREELIAVMQADKGSFKPYIAYAPGVAVNQWAELNHSPLWTSFHLWRDGGKVEANCARCPKTTALLDTIPMADQPGFAPTAMFSVLQPRTRIPAHTGSTNARLVGHLPLILPEGCGFRVGNDTREWKMGEAWVFDDSIDHEAWNNSDQVRTILIFDTWNPFITPPERELVNALLAAAKAYYAEG